MTTPSPPASGKTTPLLQQYEAAKAAYPDSLLLFRMGDFYEAFGDDALTVAKILSLSLTRRGDRAMTGFPCHYLDRSKEQLVAAGHRVAVAEFNAESPE